MKMLLIQLTTLAAFTLKCHGAALAVRADANIFGAGHTSPPHLGGGGSGSLPPCYSFPPGPGKILSFTRLTGKCTLTAGLGLHGPGGYPLPTDINSTGGISGIRHDREGFLVGVFLGPGEPTSPAPARLDFRAAAQEKSSATLSPEIGQTFYIADPLPSTDSDAPQRFHIPEGATRLFLGFADAYEYTGDPGQYQDNEGSLEVTFEITQLLDVSAAPGPELVVFPAIELRWRSEPTKLYQIQWTPSLTQPQWLNLGSKVAPTTADMSLFVSTTECQLGFYRLQVLH